MGDKFENISNATIVNRSIVEGSFNKVKDDFGEETANALRLVADEIDKSGNKEAAETFEEFNKELQKPEPRKTILKTLWMGTVAALPLLENITGITEQVIKLFGG